ncbi:hypothetical protein P8452_30773 [Trifolium repens]|nr:hypothetical protein P8452_30773 [Trifolium repens]
MLPLCDCKCPMAMVMYIAKTLWEEILEMSNLAGSRPMVDSSRAISNVNDKQVDFEAESKSIVKCNCAEENDKLKAKWKKKLSDEKKKISILKVVVFISWMLFLVLYAKKCLNVI